MSFPIEFKMAAKIAVKCLGKDRRKSRMACVIRRKDGAIVKASNITIKNPGSRMPDCHAEARATRKADVGAVAYVIRVMRDGTYGNAKPCHTCEAIMRAKGVKKAYYTLSDIEWACVELDS